MNLRLNNGHKAVLDQFLVLPALSGCSSGFALAHYFGVSSYIRFSGYLLNTSFDFLGPRF